MTVEPAPRGRSPFDTSGVERGSDGISRYANRPDSLVHMLQATVERVGDRLAVAEVGGDRLTYRELWERAARVAGGLRAEGVERGDRVAIRLPNGLDWVLAFWGSQLSGAVVVPVNTRFKESEAQYVIDDSGASYVFGALPDGEPLVVDDLGPDDLAAIFYTSGTTGFPKGAMTSHANFLSNSENAVRCVGIDRDGGEDHATIINVPLFHVTGCNSQLVLLHELGGTRLRPQQSPRPRGVPADGERGGGGHAHLGAGDLSRADAASGLRRARTWMRWSSSPTVGRRSQRAPSGRSRTPFPRLGWATASASPRPLRSPRSSRTRRRPTHADSVGFAMPVCDLAIDEPDPETGVGELSSAARTWCRATGTSRTPPPRPSSTAGCTPATSAASTTDGLLYIVDRKKDMINRGGENVYSIEVESAMAGAPGVAEVAAVGVPDDMMGEKVGAVIVPTARARSRSRPSSLTSGSASPTSRSRSTSPCAPSRCRAIPAARS